MQAYSYHAIIIVFCFLCPFEIVPCVYETLSLFCVNVGLPSTTPAHPEELTNSSFVDRLNRFEAKLGSVQKLLDRTVAENINMKDRLDNITSYASVLKRVEPVERQKVNSPVAAVLTADRASRSSSSDEEPPHQVTPVGSPSQQVRDQPFPRYPQTGRGTENAGHNNVQIDKNDNNGEQRNVTDRR